MKNQDSLGILSMLLACLFFSLMNAFIKILSEDISIMQSMFFRSLLMSAFMLSLFFITPPKRTHTQGGYLPLLIRTCFGGVSMLLTFYNIATIPLGIASTFAQTTPLYAVFLAYFFLKESLSPLVFIATGLGFAGILLISSPSSNIPFVNIIVGILSGLGAGVALVSVRECKKYFEERVIILAFGIVATVLSLACLIVGEFYPIGIFAWSSIEGDLWWIILIMGICGTLGQYFMTKAFILAPAGIVSPIDYTKIVFSLIFGIYLGDQLPNFTSLMGMILVIISGVMIALPIFIKDYKHKNANSRASKNR